MFERVPDLVAEHAELERRLADPAIHADAAQARKLGRRYADLGPIVRAYSEWRRVGEDRDAALELAADDSAFAAEADQLAERQADQRHPGAGVGRPQCPQRRQGAQQVADAGKGPHGGDAAHAVGHGARRARRGPVSRKSPHRTCRGERLDSGVYPVVKHADTARIQRHQLDQPGDRTSGQSTYRHQTTCPVGVS